MPFCMKRLENWISTHAPLARCDRPRHVQYWHFPISTHAPLARCDGLLGYRYQGKFISTHAPLARCDDRMGRGHQADRHFNSRTSCEVRRVACIAFPPVPTTFQLTHLLRGATPAEIARNIAEIISTHAPLARCDGRSRLVGGQICDFNSRTSCEVRRHVHTCGATSAISTHAPLARCDKTMDSA